MRLDQGLHAFLQKKWIAFGALQQTLPQRHEADVVSQKGLEEFLGVSRGQRV
jgi:hypothetical protein